jgi:hypothetical protein
VTFTRTRTRRALRPNSETFESFTYPNGRHLPRWRPIRIVTAVHVAHRSGAPFILTILVSIFLTALGETLPFVIIEVPFKFFENKNKNETDVLVKSS